MYRLIRLSPAIQLLNRGESPTRPSSLLCFDFDETTTASAMDSAPGIDLVPIIVPMYLILVILFGILVCQISRIYKHYRNAIKRDGETKKVLEYLETLTRIMLQKDNRGSASCARRGGGNHGNENGNQKPAGLEMDNVDEQVTGYDADADTASQNDSCLQQLSAQTPADKCTLQAQSSHQKTNKYKYPELVASTPNRQQCDFNEMDVFYSGNHELVLKRSPEHTFPKTLDLEEGLPANSHVGTAEQFMNFPWTRGEDLDLQRQTSLFDLKLPATRFAGKFSHECQFSRSLCHDDLKLDSVNKIVGTRYQIVKEDLDYFFQPQVVEVHHNETTFTNPYITNPTITNNSAMIDVEMNNQKSKQKKQRQIEQTTTTRTYTTSAQVASSSPVSSDFHQVNLNIEGISPVRPQKQSSDSQMELPPSTSQKDVEKNPEISLAATNTPAEEQIHRGRRKDRSGRKDLKNVNHNTTQEQPSTSSDFPPPSTIFTGDHKADLDKVSSVIDKSFDRLFYTVDPYRDHVLKPKLGKAKSDKALKVHFKNTDYEDNDNNTRS